MMLTLLRDGVRLAYDDTDPSNCSHPSLLLIHGWCGDRTALSPQLTAFRASHRVIAVDLRGFGDSDAPAGEYTMASFADDLAYMCGQLHLSRPLVVGHSMGSARQQQQILAACSLLLAV